MFDDEKDPKAEDDQELIEDLDAGELADQTRGGNRPIPTYTAGPRQPSASCTCCQLSV
ncbi:MAG: hypothetical protein ACYDHH_04190 [Solirubrobacteraceae bacterium]